MGRKSPITEKQWEQIGKRYADGEGARPLAKEFGVSEAAIRKRFSAHIAQVKRLANQVVATEVEIKKLPISTQIEVRTLADRLKAVSEHLAGAAEYGASTAHRLSALANTKLQEIDDIDPEKSGTALASVAVLMRTANISAEIPCNLLNANKERIKAINEEAPRPQIDMTDAARRIAFLLTKATQE